MNRKKIKIIFFGTPGFVIPIVKTLNSEYDLVAVVTAPDKPVGRKQILTQTDVARYTEELRIKNFELRILKPEKLDKDFTLQIKNLNPDLIIVAAYGKIIPKSILEIPRFRALNIHPSMLPKYRGASPIQSAILNGDPVSGISVMQMDEQMDHGPIVFQDEFRFSEEDNFETLSTKMFLKSAELLPEVIDGYISGDMIPIQQDEAKAIYCQVIKKEDGFFTIDSPPSPTKLDRMIRAYYPWPVVWTIWKRVTSHPRLNRGHQSSEVGQGEKVVKFLPGGLVQMEGKKPTPLPDFLRGYPDFPIKKLC